MNVFRNSLVVSFGVGLIAFSGFSMAVGPVTENFNDDPATDADSSTNWVNVGGNYTFQPSGDNTGLVAPPGGVATGPGEAGGSSGAGGYYGDSFTGAGTLGLNDPVSISGVVYLGGNEGGMLFGYVNSAVLPLSTDPREFHPGQFLGIRTNSGGLGHSIDLKIGGVASGSANNQIDVQAFRRAEPGDPAGDVLFNSTHPFTLTYDPGSASGPNFGSISLFVEGGVANDPDAGETFTHTFTASDRPNPANISFDRLAMFGAESQTAAFDDLTYTSPRGIPEPGGLGLIGLGSILAIRHRRR